MESRDIAPGLLLAMPQLEDPNFVRSVVLMVEHNSEGSFGLILNRPSDLKVTEVLETLSIEWSGDDDEVVWSGGPVMPRTGWVLHEPTDLPARMRFVLGFSGWGSSQLESELASGAWLAAEASAEIIFETPAEAMWETVLRSLGIDPATLVSVHGVH
jgi:putative transcriptional regulator